LQVGPSDAVAKQIRQTNLGVTGEASPQQKVQEAPPVSPHAWCASPTFECLDRIGASGEALPGGGLVVARKAGGSHL
jgi:hypothetical protein